MISLDEIRKGDPVEHWCQDHGILPPPLRCSVALALPGGTLSLRTNHSGMAAYVRDRCRYFLHHGQVLADVVAEVLCFPGRMWPAVHPWGRVERLAAESFTTFHSIAQDGILCTWKPPTLMGCLRQGRIPQIRVVTTQLNPRLLPRVLDGQRLRLNGTGLKYPNVLDLVFCLLGRSQGFTVLHGAVLEKDGLGVLMLGESGCGKTTAALALVRGGFRLLTDEYALLWNRGSHRGRFSGILVPPMVVGQPFRALKRLEESLGQPRKFGKNVFPVSKDRVQFRPVKVAAMLSLKRPESRAVAHQATPLTSDEAFASLMSQLRDPIRSGRSEAFEAMLDMLATVRACRVEVGRELKSFPDFVEGLAAEKKVSSSS